MHNLKLITAVHSLAELSFNYNFTIVEECVTEWLTPQTQDLEVRGSSLALHVVSLDNKLYSTLSLLTHVYKWVPATYCWVG